MITITDVTNGTTPHWEAVDSTGKLGEDNFPYDPIYLSGYDRIRVLQQIIDVYSIMSGCKKQEWQTQGKVFILSN